MSRFRWTVAQYLCDVLSEVGDSQLSAEHIQRHLSVVPGAVAALSLSRSALSADQTDLVSRRMASGDDGWLRGCSRDQRGALLFHLCPVQYRCDVIGGVVAARGGEFWRGPLISAASAAQDQRRIVVDFSSPNIAKPFHVGHLRSTIIGNFICNVLAATGPVPPVRLNYLGDWGTQFGLLSLGCQQQGLSTEDVQQDPDPLKTLMDVYIATNARADQDDQVMSEARRRLSLLEKGDDTERRWWRVCREVSLKALEAGYSRLGVDFDVLDGESMYPASACVPAMDLLRSAGVAESCDDAQFARLQSDDAPVLLRSDGTPTYLLRDVAAALDRCRRFGSHQLLYVVDVSQHLHFKRLRQLMAALGADIDVQHVRFGRVQGMSTRRGQAVFMHELLDEAQQRMLENQRTSRTTPLLQDPEATADALAVSAVVVNDLRQRRRRDFTFSWDAALRDSGDSGVRLQYTHCRLCSLEARCGLTLDLNASLEPLHELEALVVVSQLARYEETLLAARQRLEPSLLVVYLFRLCGAVNAALGKLRVKQQPQDVAQARLLMFHASRTVLAHGLSVLGIKPLKEM